MLAMVSGTHATFAEQRQNIVQLSRDRKNAVGGYSAGLKDFSEMGPPSGEHWPLSAEQISRAFGVPKERGNPESVYVMTLRAESHVLLEQAAERLRHHVPYLYAAWDRVFDPDSAGDRDYEWFQKRVEDARRRAEVLKSDLDDLPLARKRQKWAEIKEQFATWSRQATQTAELLERCNLFLDMLTLQLMSEELIVEFATRMTRLAEQAMEDENKRIFDEYLDFLNQKPKKEARKLICRKHGISDATLYRIEANHRQEQGLPARGPGRPKKEAC